MLETHITSVAFNWNDVCYKLNAKTIDFVTPQFTFELLAVVLYPCFRIYIYYKLGFFFFLLN